MLSRETLARSGTLKKNVARLIFRRAKEVGRVHADEIRTLIFNENLNFIQIAERVIPVEHGKSVPVAAEIIRKAARKILGEQKYQSVSHKNKVEAGKKNKGKNAQVLASLAAQGLSQWSNEERERLKILIALPEYQYKEGWTAGRPMPEKIALALNLEFYGKRPARSPHGIRGGIVSLRKDTGDEFAKRIDWEKVKPTLLALLQRSDYLYPDAARFGRSGKPNLIKIAAKLCELFPDQPVIKPHNISLQLRSMEEVTDTTS